MQAKTFSGGYKFKRFRGQAQDKVQTQNLASLPLHPPYKVLIPLTQELAPSVKLGDDVYAGQIIASDDSTLSSPIHSSINGKVIKIETANYFDCEVCMVTIDGDGSEDYRKIDGYFLGGKVGVFSERKKGDNLPQWEKLSSREIEDRLYKSGVTSLDREGIPTHFQTSVIEPEEVRELIIHGVESEIYNLSLELLLKGDRLAKFVEGLKILEKIMPQAKIHLALNREKKAIIEKVRGLISDFDRLEIYPVVPKYPQSYDEILVPTILNRKFPTITSSRRSARPESLTANIGVVILSVQTVLHAYEAVVEGKPLIDRIVALCGPGFKENLHLKARLGTPLGQIIRGRVNENDDLRFILNSPLTGKNLELASPIDQTFSCIIALPEEKSREFFAFVRPGAKRDSYSRTFLSSLFRSKKQADTNLKGEERPCISCNFCQEVCPMDLIPHLIYRYVERELVDDPLIDFKIFDCIECNLCSYVCPSKIPVAKYIKEGKEMLVDQSVTHNP